MGYNYSYKHIVPTGRQDDVLIDEQKPDKTEVTWSRLRASLQLFAMLSGFFRH